MVVCRRVFWKQYTVKGTWEVAIHKVLHSLVHSCICYYSQPTVLSLSPTSSQLSHSVSSCLCVAFGYIILAVGSNPRLPPPSSLCGLDRLSRWRLSLVTRGKDVRWNGSVSDESSVLFLLHLLLTSPQTGCLCASPAFHRAPSCSCIR